MGRYSERFLVRFLFDILKSSLVGLEILLRSLIDARKGYQTNDVSTIERVHNSVQGLTRGD